MEKRRIPDKFRSSRWQMFFKIGVLKNFANFTGKHLRWSLFLIKLEAQTCNFIKKRLQNRCFPVKFAKFCKHLFLQKISGGCFRKLKYKRKNTILYSESLKRGSKRLNMKNTSFPFYLAFSTGIYLTKFNYKNRKLLCEIGTK